jgi:hypothetical protein
MLRLARLALVAGTVLFALIPAAARAQGDRASIVGAVQDSSGAVLPGVTVEASSPALIEKSRTVITDEAGRYAIIDLRPGTYTVEFILQGFSRVRREGIVLEGAFAATVNASLAVGAVEETITVTGASPVVDLQNTRTQVVVNQDVLQALPVMRSIQDQANLVPGVVSRSTSAGQILSDFYINSMAARGATDQHIVYDGMKGGNMMLGGGTQAIAGGVNELGQAEMTYEISGHSAEFAEAGVRMDAIPKDGGNAFSGTYRFFGSNKNLQSNNLTAELEQQGLRAVNRLDYNWNSNAAVGGPIMRDKLWFFSAFELSQYNILVANVFFANGEQADTGGGIKPNGTARFTYQASGKDRLRLSYNNSTSHTQRYDFSATTTPEAGLVVRSPINYSGILKWTRTATNRVLVEVGQSIAASTYFWEYQPEVGPFEVANINASTGITSKATAIAPVRNLNHSYNTVANLSYVTGSHAFKTGINYTGGRGRTTVEPHGDIVALTFANIGGVTRGTNVTVRNSPVTGRERLNADIGVYAQDKWTINRLTVTPGFRFDYLNASVPAQTAPAGRFVPARQAPAISCLPCWSDWSVRVGAAYDLFGNGKTAIKASVGRYLSSQVLGIAESVNPIRSRSETRTWTDLDGNGSALDANGNAQYNEIGASPVGNFGVPAGATRLDPDTPRPSNWEETVSVVQEVIPGFAVTVGYFHRHFQNLSITRNLAVNPLLDYTPFTIVGPTNANLANNGGELITLYTLNQNKFGVPADSVSTFSTANSRVYDGFELGFNARLPRGGFLFGGITTERTKTNSCDVDNPNDLRFCDRRPPFRTLYKASAGYTLPYDLQLSASLQAVPGNDISATYRVSNAIAGRTILPSGFVNVNLVEPNTMFYDYQTQVDGRVARSFRIGRQRLQAYMDFFNLFNSSSVVSVNTTYGTNWLRPLVVLQARRFQFGGRFDF